MTKKIDLTGLTPLPGATIYGNKKTGAMFILKKGESQQLRQIHLSKQKAEELIYPDKDTEIVEYFKSMIEDYGPEIATTHFKAALADKQEWIKYDKTFPEDAFTGVFKTLRNVYAPTTEAPDCYLFGTTLSLIGSLIGRKAYIPGGGTTRLYPNFFVLLLGESAITRKSTAQRIAIDLLRELEPQDNIDACRILQGGIASAEGLMDAFPKNSTNNRLAIFQDEFTEFMSKAITEGSRYIKERLQKIYDCPKM